MLGHLPVHFRDQHVLSWEDKSMSSSFAGVRLQSPSELSFGKPYRKSFET